MGHRRKKQRDLALVAPLLHKFIPTLPPKTTRNTDRLTGERLHDGTARMVIPDDDRIAYRRNPEPSDLTPENYSAYAQGYRVSLPTRLHTRETEGELGGHAYAAPFLKFLDAGMPRRQQRFASERLSRQEYMERFWWSPEWAEAELRATYAADVVDIVLAVRRDHQSWDMAMVGSDRALGDVQAQMHLMAAHCRMLIRQETMLAAA